VIRKCVWWGGRGNSCWEEGKEEKEDEIEENDDW
jgi:hypothetical protein